MDLFAYVCTLFLDNYDVFSFLFSSLEAPDLKQEERLQELESCSGVGSTSDDTEVREVSSRPSTPGLSVVSGKNHTHVQHPFSNFSN